MFRCNQERQEAAAQHVRSGGSHPEDGCPDRGQAVSSHYDIEHLTHRVESAAVDKREKAGLERMNGRGAMVILAAEPIVAVVRLISRCHTRKRERRDDLVGRLLPTPMAFKDLNKSLCGAPGIGPEYAWKAFEKLPLSMFEVLARVRGQRENTAAP